MRINSVARRLKENHARHTFAKLQTFAAFEVEGRDAADALIDSVCSSCEDFAWAARLRFYFENPAAIDMDGVDAGRTLALATFGFFHYGVTAKTLYLWYDRILGKTPTVRNAMTKMVLDVYVHTPLLLIPTFYAITCSLRGRSVDETASQLRREWWDASFGSAVFWTPLCLLNFLYVPQHSRIAAISVGSFVHKTWLSWLSNRHKI